jgi:hypothetical protein
MLWIGVMAVSAAALLLSAAPTRVAAAEGTGKNKCGERANPVDGQTEHRFQTDGICVSGGDHHEEWWLAPCIPENHKSAPC